MRLQCHSQELEKVGYVLYRTCSSWQTSSTSRIFFLKQLLKDAMVVLPWKNYNRNRFILEESYNLNV